MAYIVANRACRSVLRSQWAQARRGSNPLSRTTWLTPSDTGNGRRMADTGSV